MSLLPTRDATDGDVVPCGKKSMIFASTRQRSKGLTKVIKTVFFPGYSYSKLRGGREHGTLSLRSARGRGKTVDRQLARCVGREATLPPRATPETRAVLEHIQGSGYYIESAQRPVGWAPWRVATWLDLVLRPVVLDHRPDHRVVVEVKRGCLYRRCSVPGAKSRHLDPAVGVSPIHMHQLQAEVGRQMLQRVDPSLPVRAMLLYVDEAGVEAVTDFAVAWSAQTERALVETSQLCAGRKRKAIRKRPSILPK